MSNMNCLHPSFHPSQKSSCLSANGHGGGLSASIDLGESISNSFIAARASSASLANPVSYPPATSDFANANANANVGLIPDTATTIIGNNNDLFIFQSLYRKFP